MNRAGRGCLLTNQCWQRNSIGPQHGGTVNIGLGSGAIGARLRWTRVAARGQCASHPIRDTDSQIVRYAKGEDDEEGEEESKGAYHSLARPADEFTWESVLEHRPARTPGALGGRLLTILVRTPVLLVLFPLRLPVGVVRVRGTDGAAYRGRQGATLGDLRDFDTPDNTTHPVKLDGTYGPNVPSNLTGMRKFPYHGYTTCIMAVSLYHAYHGTPQTCGGMKNTPNTFLDATCDMVTAKGRGACRRWLWYHTYHGWPYGSVHTLHTAGQEHGGAWRAKYHAYHDMFPDVIVKLPRHQLPWVGTIGAAPLPPSETLKKYHAYLVYRRTWGVEIPHVPQMCGGDAVLPSAGTLGGARTMGTM
ncbi:hypothetical protein C8J57DRAFT_1255044 [Mycena rebaudengoi]|nr:hypothetical protein C8J57DRAFT_1255044 [Mycena rebaudengoi]